MKAWTQLLEPGPALATVCLVLIVSSQADAAPTSPDEHAEQSTEIEYYPVADATGCYYNFQHYDEGDRIITNEPCLNCTCHNRMLMCYLRVCPFTKAIGANCKVEKRTDQCCPVITCPEVPVQLVTSTAPSTALGHLNEYGCSIDNLFYSDGARVPSDPENPCELCYCIRNKTACVMQECTLNVEGCTPVFQEGVCCPVRYNCEHPDYLEGPTTPQITTTTSTTTTLAPTTTQQSVKCFFEGRSYSDGELAKKDIPCEKCYCLKGDIVCAVQECGPTPLDKVNCTALPIREGQCCPDTYDCAGIIEEELTTLSSLSYEPEPTTLPISDVGVTQGPLTTAPQIIGEEDKERKKLEGLTEGTEVPEVISETTTAAPAEKPHTEGGPHLIKEEDGGKMIEGTEEPEIIKEITRQPVEASKPAEQATEKLLEQTTRPAIEEPSAGIQEVTEGTQTTEKYEIEQVTIVGVETETTEKERVTIVTAITPEDATEGQESTRKPPIKEETTKPSVGEETAKPTESSIELVTSRVTEAIESVTSTITEAVEAITKAIIGSSTEEPTTEVPEEVVTEEPKEGQPPGKEDVTEQPKENEKETEEPEELVTKIIAITEREPAFPTHPTIVPEKERPEETSESSDKEKPSIPEKEHDTSEATEESIKEPSSERTSLAEEQPTTISAETEKPEQEQVAHDENEGVEGDQETKSPVVETERPGAIEEGTKADQPREDITEAQPSVTERTEASEISEKTESPKKVSETESIETGVTEKGATSEIPKEEHERTEEPTVPTEAPKTEHEKTEEPTLPTEAPKTEHEKTEEPTLPTEAPKTEHEKTEKPTLPTEASKTEHEKTEEPTLPTEAPKTEHEKTEEPTLPTEAPKTEQEKTEEQTLPSEAKPTEPTEEIKPGKGPVSITEEPLVHQECTEQDCVTVRAEKPLATEQPAKEGTSHVPEVSGQPGKEQPASEKPIIEQTTQSAEQTTVLPTDRKPGQPELTEPSTTEKEEVVIVTEIPTKKTELPESMDHVFETAYPTETPKEGTPPIETETEKVELQEVSSTTEKIQPKPDYTTKAPTAGQTGPPSQESGATEGTSEGQPKEPFGTTEIPVSSSKGQTELPEEPVTKSAEKEPVEGTDKPTEGTPQFITEIPKRGTEIPTAETTQFITDIPREGTEVPSAETPQFITEIPKEEENEIEHREPVATVPKTEGEIPEGGETKIPEEPTTTEVSKESEKTTHKKHEPEEPITEKAIIPEVCTSESECAPGAAPPLSEVETEEPISQTSVKPEQEPAKTEGTTESNKIPESEEHTEETNEIPEAGTEEITKVTSEPHHEESSGEKPGKVPSEEGEGSGQEPEEGSGFTSTTTEESEITETVYKGTKEPEEQPTEVPEIIAEVTKGLDEQSETTTVTQEEGKPPKQTSISEKPATSRPQETSTDEEERTEQPKTDETKLTEPTEEYPEGTELPEREIPGEGSCLVDGQTYENDSSVPPINHCQTSCKCVSSILKCESIGCTPPPPGMQNCLPIFLSPDSCCPTYSCTGPEPDSHVVQTTTPLPEEPATVRPIESGKTERPEASVTTVAAEQEEGKSEAPEESTEVGKDTITIEAATEKEPSSTKLPVLPEESTQPQSQITEQPIVSEHCDELGCKPSSQPEQKPDRGTDSTESSVTITSPETEISQETVEPESVTEISKEPQPEEGKPQQVTEAKLPEKDHVTTAEPIIIVKPENETSVSESTSRPSEESKPSDRTTIKPEEGTQVLIEAEPDKQTEETGTEKLKETELIEGTTEKAKQTEQETAKPEVELPEAVTKTTDKEVSTEIAQTIIPGEEETRRPEEIATTEKSKEPVETGTEPTEITGKPFSGMPEGTSEIESDVTKKPTLEEKKPEEPGHVKPTEVGITEEPLTESTLEPSKFPVEETVKPIEITDKPEIIEVESTTLKELPEKVSEETILPENEVTPEGTTESSGEVKDGKTTEHPRKPAEQPEKTEIPEVQEHDTTEEASRASELPEGLQPITTPPTGISTDTASLETGTKLPEKEEGSVTIKESTESSITEQEEPGKKSEDKLPQTTVVPKGEDEPVQHITMPPESERTRKPIESESHVTGPESGEETTSKVIAEKSTEKVTEGPLTETPKAATEVPSEVTKPLEEAGKPGIHTEQGTHKPALTEQTISVTTESIRITGTEATVTKGLPEEASQKPDVEVKVPTEEETKIPDITEETTVPSATEPSSSERTAEDHTKERTESALSSQTEKISEESSEVPVAATESASSPLTERTPEKYPEVPVTATESASTPQTERISEESSKVPVAATESALSPQTETSPGEFTEVPESDTKPALSPQTEITPEESSEGPVDVTESVSSPQTEKSLQETSETPVPETEGEKETPLVEGMSPVPETEKSPGGEGTEKLSETEKATDAPETLQSTDVTEEPSTIDNEIPGVVPQKETPEQRPESTEQPQKEFEVSTVEEATKEPEKEIELTRLPEGQAQTHADVEKVTTLSSVEKPSSVVPKDEQLSEQPPGTSTSTRTPAQPEEETSVSGETEEPSVTEGIKTSIPEETTKGAIAQPEGETLISGETEKPSVTEEIKTSIPEETTEGAPAQPEGETHISGGTEKPSVTEERTSIPEETTNGEGPKAQPEKETPVVDTERPTVLEEEQEGKPATTEQPTAGETKIPGVPEEEGKIPTEKQSFTGQTEQPTTQEKETQTLASERPQETQKPIQEEQQTAMPGVSGHETEEPDKPEEPTTQETETEKPIIHEEIKTPIPEQPAGETTEPSIREDEKTPATVQSIIETDKPSISETETSTSEKPGILPEEAVTRKPVEASQGFTTPETTTSTAENVSLPALFTSGPKVDTTTKLLIPGELSTSAPVSEVSEVSEATTILPATTSTDSTPAHIPGEKVPELPDYEQPGDYDDDDQNAFGPGTCRYGGKVYVSAQQIPREDPCDFCFCFRSDIICLQQSCPPPIPRCHEEPIRGFCCPRYECPVSMATAVNVTTSTTTTTTTLPPHFLSHAYKGRASKTGCQISGKAYKVGEPIRATSGPCLHCTCGGDGQMKCDPKPCSPEPMLRQMIAAAASRRRR